MSKLLFSVHSEDATTYASVSRALAATGRVQVVAGPSSPRALAELLRSGQVDGIYVDLDRRANELLELLEETPAPRPVLVFGGSYADPQLLVRAMRLQPLDFLVKHDVASLAERIEQLAEDSLRRPIPLADMHGVLAVAGSKGGVGTTFVACELASALQQRGESAVVVDLNLRFSDIALYFDLKPLYTLADVARKGEALDETFLATTLASHASGVRVLAGPSSFEDGAAIGPGTVEATVRLLREQFEWVVLDLPSTWDELCLRALNAADQILLVTRVDVPSLTHTKQQLELLERLGAPRDRVRVLVNRYSRSSPFSEKELKVILGRMPDLVIPADDAIAARCANEGKLLSEAARGGKLERSIKRLAALSCKWVRGENAARPAGSVLARWFRRGKGGA
jgi:pilus assembly protein CpaE